MDPRIDQVLEVWVGGPSARWFRKDLAFDAELRLRFSALHEDAAAGRLAAWHNEPRGQLALVILLDQFSRNMFRGEPRAFATDAQALAIARELRASPRLRELAFLEQMFTLLPFEHTEDVELQAAGVAGFAELVATARAERAPTEVVALLESGLDYARKHLAIIERFGRFPHRNALLGRTSTPEELGFLEQPGSSF